MTELTAGGFRGLIPLGSGLGASFMRPAGSGISKREVGGISVLLLACICVLQGCASKENDQPPKHVLLMTVDTLRADHLLAAPGLYREATMPFVRSLLAEGSRFEWAVSPLPRTTQALASLLTGQYPHRTGVRFLTDRLDASVPSLAEMAQDSGYQTIAVVSNHMLTPSRGLDRGFQVYDSGPDSRDARQTTDAALSRLSELSGDQPLFLWVHYIDPHVPYYPPKNLAERFDPAYRGRYRHHFGGVKGGVGNRAYPGDLGKKAAVFENRLPDSVNSHIRALYAADIRYTDREIERLVGRLRDEFGSDWLIVFASDHGESLGEHDFYYDHGDYVYNATTRVPLGIVFPNGKNRVAREITETVSLVDITPTLVEILGLAVDPQVIRNFEGRSLAPLLRGESLPPRPVFSESGKSYFPESVRGRKSFDVGGRFRSIQDGSWKLILTPGKSGPDEHQLYDLSSDPNEARNVAEEFPARVRDLRLALARWMDRAHAPEAVDISEEDERTLRSLGYVED